jgi:hypothetical protein
MAERHVTFYGIYGNSDLADNALDYMAKQGFSQQSISILHSDDARATGTRPFAYQKHTKSPEGAVTGAIIGALIGGAFALVVGLGALFIAGLEPLFAAGPVIACLAGVGSGGFVGGVIGALVGAGIPEFEARRYTNISKGGVLLAIHCNSTEQAALAKTALRETGARSISSTGTEPPVRRIDEPRRAA